jgi:hypothetical protein
MKVIQHSEPWEHFEVHDFLDSSDFNSIKIHAESLPLNADRTMNVLRSGYVHDILARAMYKLLDEIKYTPRVEDEITVQLDAIKPGWAYNKIHADNPKKWVTFVMAISDQGTGTQLYTKDQQTLVKTTDWIPNGGNGFIRKEDTWHDFDAKGLTDIRRTAIVMLAEKGWDSV